MNRRDGLSPGEELALYEALRLGSGRAFRALLDVHGPAMLRIAGWYTGDRATAERLVRATWVTALGGLDMFTWHCTFRAWLFGILVSHGRSLRVRHGRAPHVTLRPPSPAALAPRPADVSLDWEHLAWSPRWSPASWQVLAAAVEALPADQRDAVRLRDVEGWPTREVCDALALAADDEHRLLHASRGSIAHALEVHLAAAGCDDACGQAPIRVTEYLEDGLPAAARQRFEAHLRGCRACACRLQRLRGVIAVLAMAEQPQPASLPDAALVDAFRRWRAARRLSLWRRFAATRRLPPHHAR